MSTLKNLELLYAAAYEGTSSFEEMVPLGEFTAPEETEENTREMTYTFAVNAEAAVGGDPVFAQITLTVRKDGGWDFKAESGLYDFAFETAGSLQKPKDAGKALDFIESLNLTYLYNAFEKPTNLEAELAAAYAGYLKRLQKYETRGGKLREEPIVYTAAVEQAEGITIDTDEKRMTMEELLEGLDANDALSKLLREGPADA